MRTAALLCLVLTGCATHVQPTLQSEAPIAAAMGCWEVAPLNFKSSYLPTPTQVRLDSASAKDAGYYHLERLTPAPAGTVEERNYWYINPGDQHVMMKLGDGSKGVWLDLAPQAEGKRMYGRAGTGAHVRATRIDCQT